MIIKSSRENVSKLLFHLSNHCSTVWNIKPRLSIVWNSWLTEKFLIEPIFAQVNELLRLSAVTVHGKRFSTKWALVDELVPFNVFWTFVAILWTSLNFQQFEEEPLKSRMGHPSMAQWPVNMTLYFGLIQGKADIFWFHLGANLFLVKMLWTVKK